MLIRCACIGRLMTTTGLDMQRQQLEMKAMTRAAVLASAQVIDLACALAFTVALTLALTLAPAPAQAAAQAEGASTKAENAPRTFRFDIDAMPLIAALARFSEITGIQIVYPAGDGLKGESSVVAGTLSPDRALRAMLEGTGIAFRFVNAQTITLERSSAANQTRVLNPVKVEGAARSTLPASGLNGSTDVTATEGSGSYTTSALMIGGKTARSLREAQQSVSVLTAQRIADQNLTDLTQALNQSTGVTLIQGQSSTETSFYSRGYEITAFQFDGGTPMYFAGSFGAYGNFSLPDMALFDHIELLRGADGMFGGAGQPGGSVNLVRKRPLDHAQFNLTVTAGSWNNYRADLDITGPIDPAGRFRGRLISVYEDRDFFYDAAYNKKTLISGSVETDLTASTLLTAGIDYENRDTLPWVYGLPRYKDGSDLKLSRSTCLCTDWSRWEFETTDLFARIEQKLWGDWMARLNVTRRDQSSFEKYGALQGGVPTDPADTYAPTLTGWSYGYANLQKLVDLTVSGGFDLFGGHHSLIVGMSWQNVDGSGGELQNAGGFYPEPPFVDVFAFNPHAFPEPAALVPDRYYLKNGQVQRGAYGTLNLQVLPRLHVLGGARYSQYTYDFLHRSTWLDAPDENGNPLVTYYNEHKEESAVITPYYGATYDLTDELSAYASFTDIFNSLYSYRSGPPPGSEALKPTTGGNLEVGIRGEFREGRLNASLAAYRIDQKDLPEVQEQYESYSNYGNSPTNASFFCCYVNGARQLSEGVDAEVTGEVMPGWQLSAGYTYNINKYTSGFGSSSGQSLETRSPKHLLKLWSMFRLRGALSAVSAGFGANAQSKGYYAGYACFAYQMEEWGLSCSDQRPYAFTQGAYAVLNGLLEYRPTSNWTASLNVNNLLDRTYYATVGNDSSGNWYGEPRNVMLTLRGKF